ncbi:MAG TPA: MarR family transcriptional regulator [Candidatus Dormibacteraeota bacterium]|nr:MarR family transcriptional regulator [Candidatus Dormibacteraeota bacterium]
MSSRSELQQLVDSRLRRATTAIDGLDRRAAAIFGVNRTDLRLLDLLASRGPLTAGGLAKAAGMSTGGMTVALDRMESAGYVQREPNAQDRRSIVVRVTDRVAAPSREAFGSLQTWLTAALTRYSGEQLELLAEFLGTWGDAVEATLES